MKALEVLTDCLYVVIIEVIVMEGLEFVMEVIVLEAL